MSERISRLDIRTTNQAKQAIEHAANIVGVTMSSFVLESAIERATQVIESNQRIRLNQEESEHFLALMDNPPEENESLRQLFEKHKNSVGGIYND
jgi:uncharacterized protein (DUF1778 family)